MRLFDEQTFKNINNKKIVIIGTQNGAKLIRELLLFKGYEVSLFLEVDVKNGFVGGIRNTLGLRAVSILGDRAVIFSAVVLTPKIIDELESNGIHSADIYDMTQYLGGVFQSGFFRMRQSF